MIRKFSGRLSLLLLMLAMAAFALGGCGDDDDDNPANPGGNNGDSFDQQSAEMQADAAANQATILVESIDEIGEGVDTLKDGTYQWNENQQRWEFHYTWDYEGYQNDWYYTVQYLDEDGNPVMHRSEAVAAHHTMEGTGTYTMEQEGLTYTSTIAYNWDVMITGLHTTVYVMTGTGGYDMDYTVSGGAINIHRHYIVTWETLGDGITKPIGECPTGVIRYHFDPYTLDVTFDGTTTASWVLKDGSGNTIRTGTEDFSCGS